MIVSSPRIFGTPRRPGDRLVSVWLAATVALTFAANADAQSANASARRARVSQDLAQLLQTNGDFTPTTVIVTASQAKVDRLAARHGLTVQQRLKTGAVLQIPANRLADVAGDAEVDTLSSNQDVSGHMAVTNEATGADQVQAGLLGGLKGLSGRGIGPLGEADASGGWLVAGHRKNL